MHISKTLKWHLIKKMFFFDFLVKNLFWVHFRQFWYPYGKFRCLIQTLPILFKLDMKVCTFCVKYRLAQSGLHNNAQNRLKFSLYLGIHWGVQVVSAHFVGLTNTLGQARLVQAQLVDRNSLKLFEMHPKPFFDKHFGRKFRFVRMPPLS